MSERQKKICSEWYPAMDPELQRLQLKAYKRTYQYNRTSADEQLQRTLLLSELLGDSQGTTVIEPEFQCDFGFNIHFRGGAVVKPHCTMLDSAEIEIGNNAYIGTGVCFACSSHSLVVDERLNALAYAKPIKLGDNVWIGDHCTILGGVTIGDGAIIESGSVVTHDIPACAVAAGNPCRVLADKVSDSDRTTHRLPENVASLQTF